MIILAVLGVGVYVSFSKERFVDWPPGEPTDETVHWKIYRNNQLGFEVQYPKEWERKVEDPSPKHFSMVFREKHESRTTEFRLSVNLYGELGTPGLSRYEGEEIIVESIRLQPAIFSSEDYHLVVSDLCIDKNFKEVVPVFPACEQDSGNFYYQFSLSYKGEEWKGKEGRDNCAQLFNQILSTFRFLE